MSFMDLFSGIKKGEVNAGDIAAELNCVAGNNIWANGKCLIVPKESAEGRAQLRIKGVKRGEITNVRWGKKVCQRLQPLLYFDPPASLDTEFQAICGLFFPDQREIFIDRDGNSTNKRTPCETLTFSSQFGPNFGKYRRFDELTAIINPDLFMANGAVFFAGLFAESEYYLVNLTWEI